MSIVCALDVDGDRAYRHHVLRWIDRFWSTTATAHEPSEPFRAEVLLDGVVVATLSERVATDMFCQSYRIEPAGHARVIFDDEIPCRCASRRMRRCAAVTASAEA